MDIDQFQERAAIMEFCGAIPRFRAETLAAQAQGFQRREVIDEIGRRNFARERDQRETGKRDGDDNLPTVQRAPQKEERPVPERHVR